MSMVGLWDNKVGLGTGLGLGVYKTIMAAISGWGNL